MDMQEIHRRFKDASEYKSMWLSLYQSLYDYVLPDRDALNVRFNYIDNGNAKTNKIWDPTAMLAATQRANDIQSLLIPKDRKWGSYAMDPHAHEEQEIHAMAPMIDSVNARIEYYISNSNLSREAYGACLDLVGGTGVLYADSPSDDQPLRFRAIPALTTYIEQTSSDTVDTCWVETKMIGYRVLQEYPKISGKLKETVLGNPADIYKLLFNQIKMNNGKFHIFVTIPDIDISSPIFENETDYRQIIVFRDKVRPGESEGRGIAIDMLPMIIDLNQLVRDDRKSKAMKADPLLFYDAGQVNPWALRKISGAMVARQPGGRNPIEAIQLPTYPEIMEHEQILRDQIRKGFQVDPLGEVDSSVKSATEISIRENRAQRSAATDMARIINELPGQVFETAAKILSKRSLLFKDRKSNFINVHELRFDFKSPLFNIQKQENLDNLAQNLQMKQQFFGEGAALASVDMGEVNQYMTDNSNLPAKLFKNKDDMNKLMKGMAQAGQQGSLPTPTTQASDVQLPQSTPEQF